MVRRCWFLRLETIEAEPRNKSLTSAENSQTSSFV
jgi:hypothetical protein